MTKPKKRKTGKEPVAYVQVRIDQSLMDSFKELADENGWSLTGRIRVLIRRDIEELRKLQSVTMTAS